MATITSKRYGVWCRVTGGVTGTREAWLRGADGDYTLWDNRSDAEAEAARLNKSMNSNPHSLASFRYRAEEY